MDQAWFEMRDIRNRRLESTVWIPLCAGGNIQESGARGHIGYKTEYWGAQAIMVPSSSKIDVEGLTWTDFHRGFSHSGHLNEDGYTPADVFAHYNPDIIGCYVVLEDFGDSMIGPEWHLHQDLVLTLALRKEGDSWVRPVEGYIEVVKLLRNGGGRPRLLQIRASHLRDYLCARSMGLYIVSYRRRTEVIERADYITWKDRRVKEDGSGARWEGHISGIHEGGQPFGQETLVLHMTRTGLDAGEDLPHLSPGDDNIQLEKGAVRYEGRKLLEVSGELWRGEWLCPADSSPLVRGDPTPALAWFVTNTNGDKESKDTLVGAGSWLWFRPHVIPEIAHRRGGALHWYTQDTGSVACVPDYGVRFGVNLLGLINVYAKDIAQLPDWQQQIWAGFNVAPEGGVSEELHAAQACGEPATTYAPEQLIGEGLERINEVAESAFGTKIIRITDTIRDILARSHRFRAVDKPGLLSLAKELTRLTADSLDIPIIRGLVHGSKDERLGSLKTLERILAERGEPDTAYSAMSPFHWISDLRHADAHLPSETVDETFKLLHVDDSAPFVIQGRQLLQACVEGLLAVYRILSSPPTSKPTSAAKKSTTKTKSRSKPEESKTKGSVGPS